DHYIPHPPTPSLFLFTHPPTTLLYPLSLHDALPISPSRARRGPHRPSPAGAAGAPRARSAPHPAQTRSASLRIACSCSRFSERRSEEHTSELQSLRHLVCRLLLEKKKKKNKKIKTKQ